MSKFHINKHGAPAPCKATQGKCPLGGDSGEENHFDSKEDAQVAADEINKSQHGLLPGTVTGENSKQLTKQEELMRALRDPKRQHKLVEKKTEESRRAYEHAEKIFESADSVEDRRIAGFDLMDAKRELDENEERLSEKEKELN